MCDAFRTLTFIAQEAAPVLVASALPGPFTGPVQAARVRQTLVTEQALPAVVAPENHISVLTLIMPLRLKYLNDRQQTNIQMHITALTPNLRIRRHSA